MSDEERGILVPEWKQPEPELEFTKQQRSRNIFAKKSPLRVMPCDKSRSVHRISGTNRSVLRIHPDGIQVGMSTGEGIASSLGLLGLIFIGAVVFVWGAALPVLDFSVVLFSVVSIALLGLLLVGGVFVRRAYFSPPDHPVMFNRKTRKVQVLPIKALNLFKFWKGGKAGELRTYNWDNVQARTYRRLDVPGGTVARTETTLQMLCTTPEQPKLVDLIVSLGFTGTWADNEQVKLWEHIRRYMEEGGPPLQPGDELRKVDHSKLPQFPPEVIAAAGGPALSDAQLRKWTHPAA